ncbi:CHASE3 domain-containing protein [bacterium]|nr:CHASE3 domain-containing protein [bacterium]QQR56263.1 MAG: CHASE3 domain-containing protein [Candidatus Melainabacteria bacterium]
MKGKDQFFRYLIVGSTLAFFAIIVGLFWTTQEHLNHQSRLRLWVVHTQQVLVSISRLENTIKDVQIYEQIYGLTKKQEYYEAYKDSHQKLIEILESSIELIDDNQSQLVRLEDLKTKVRGRLAFLDEHIEQIRSGREYLVTKEDYDRLGQTGLRIRGVLKDIEHEELELFAKRTDELDAATRESFLRLQIISLVAFVVFCVAVVALYVVNRRQSRQTLSREVAYQINSILARRISLNQAVPECFKVICENLGWHTAALWRPTADGQKLQCHSFFANQPVPHFAKATSGEVERADKTLLGKVWCTGEPAWINFDVHNEKFSRENDGLQDGLKSGFMLPVYIQEKFIGVFEFFSKTILKEDANEEWLLKVICGDMAQEFERKRVEEGLQDALSELSQFHRFLDSVLQNMGSGVVVADRMGNFLLFNESAQRILGYKQIDQQFDSSQAAGLFEEDAVTPLKPEQVPLTRAINGEAVDNFILFCKIKDAQDGIWLSVNGRPILNHNGEIFGGVVVFEDVTLRKEEERRTIELYSMVSHELRTPLTSIRGALGLLEGGKAGQLSDRGKRLVTMGRKECDRLVRLINDILDVQKFDAGRLQLKPTEIGPLHLVERATENLRSLADEKNVDLQVISRIDAGKKITADKDRFLQIVTNLVSNAIKFAPKDSRIKIICEDQHEFNQIRVSVQDEGPGISEENQTRLFRSFEQVGAQANSPSEGTGLGLAISKALVQLHNGQIGLDSKEGEGATFWFTIPG